MALESNPAVHPGEEKAQVKQVTFSLSCDPLTCTFLEVAVSLDINVEATSVTLLLAKH